MADATIPTRLILCVDGTQYSPSTASKSNGNQTNIHRIYAGTKEGKCWDSSSNTTFHQVVNYKPGIGVADTAFSTDRIQASVLGQGFLKQIQEVYEACCKLTGSRDEVWLFGFSRGAYVVRAVAGLLHRFGAVASAGQPEFSRDFRKLLKEAEWCQGPGGLALSPVSSTSSAASRPAPKVKFIGEYCNIQPISKT